MVKVKKVLLSVLEEVENFIYFVFLGLVPRSSAQWLICCIWSCFMVYMFAIYVGIVSAFTYFQYDVFEADGLLLLCNLNLCFDLFFVQFLGYGLWNWFKNRFRFCKRKELSE